MTAALKAPFVADLLTSPGEPTDTEKNRTP